MCGFVYAFAILCRIASSSIATLIYFMYVYGMFAHILVRCTTTKFNVYFDCYFNVFAVLPV
jgi:hypothetical protein